MYIKMHMKIYICFLNFEWNLKKNKFLFSRSGLKIVNLEVGN